MKPKLRPVVECDLCETFFIPKYEWECVCDNCIPPHDKDEWEDIINKPKHYTNWSIEPIDYIIANDMSFCEANIVKYITRYKYKNGIQDLEKAQFYINKLIESFRLAAILLPKTSFLKT